MASVLITGGRGFLGHLLAQEVLRRGELHYGPGPEQKSEPESKPEERAGERAAAGAAQGEVSSSEVEQKECNGAKLWGTQKVVRVVALDQSAPEAHHSLPGLEHAVGDITEERFMRELFEKNEFHSVFHLAAVLSGQAESDPELGMRVNVDATRLLLGCCRRTGRALRLVMTSSVAVFGRPSVSGAQALGTPSPLASEMAIETRPIADSSIDAKTDTSGEGQRTIDSSATAGPSAHTSKSTRKSAVGVFSEDTPVLPQSSYGAQKAMCELLLSDVRRKGGVEARAVRLPTVVVRPGKPNSATSSFCSSIVREPLKGEPAVCPVAPDLPLWIQSPQVAVRNIIHAHNVHLGRAWPILTLPGLTTTPREMVGALAACGGDPSLVEWRRDEFLNRVVSSWPGHLLTPTATALGFECDPDVLSVVQSYKSQYCSRI